MTLKEWREQESLTLAQLAKKIGVSEVSVSRYENGRVPKPAIMRKIAKVTKDAVLPNDFVVAA